MYFFSQQRYLHKVEITLNAFDIRWSASGLAET